MLFLASIIAMPVRAGGTTKNYGNVTLSGGFQKGHFCDVWDLTASDLVISFTYDANGLVDDFGGGAHAWAELGARAVGYGDFNPTWMAEKAGVWLATDYDWTVNTFDADPPGAPTLDIDDKLILQKGGGWDESKYNLPLIPPDPWTNYGIWFDRDGVDPWQATYWGCIDGGTYNTGGRYAVVITLHATSATSGTAYMTVNGVSQGFWVSGWKNAQPEIYPAGMTFTGDMTCMQVFYGLYGYGATHTVVFEDITVTGSSRTLNLQFDPSSSSIVLINTDATLKVRLTADSIQVPSETVTFSSDPAGLTFTPNPQTTDSNGYAIVTATTSTASVYTVTATVCGAISDTWTLVVYEPVGMTAGGGWYLTYGTDTDTYGTADGARATFGLVAKFLKGSTTPTGNLEFQYHTCDGINLKSTTIQWLQVSGNVAQFGGTATLNGVSTVDSKQYYFRVKAQDKGEPGTSDEFMIKIWKGDPNLDGELIHASHSTLYGGNIIVRTK